MLGIWIMMAADLEKNNILRRERLCVGVFLFCLFKFIEQQKKTPLKVVIYRPSSCFSLRPAFREFPSPPLSLETD